jgi:hypothetical protein
MTKVKGDHRMTGVCEVWAVELGWDLRLMIDGHGLQMSSLCRSGREMVDSTDEWRAALVEKGWEGGPSDSEEPDEPPSTEEVPPIDDAPVPPLTVPTDI